MSTKNLELETAVAQLKSAIEVSSKNLVDRQALVETIALACVAREHLLVVGPPGTAKSEAVRRIARATGGSYFEYLISRFTEPSEIFGPVDLRKLREGIVESQTSGMLPEAEIAFLDEIFLGSTAILNTLLGILNERVFRRGHTTLPCPLRICVGASNRLPESEPLAAFGDRFLIRVFTDPIADPQLEELLQQGWNADRSSISCPASVHSIDILADAARQMDMTPVRPYLAKAIRTLRANGVNFSDRRIVKIQHLVSSAAILGGRKQPSVSDLWPVVMAVPDREGQSIARQCLNSILSHSENQSLVNAAEEASLGPLARAARIASAANQLLESGPQTSDREEWLLRLESIGREIDSCFSSETMPVALAEIRSKLLEVVTEKADVQRH